MYCLKHIPLKIKRASAFLLLLFLTPAASFAQLDWSAQSSGLVSETIKDVYFKSLTTGWVVAQYGKIIRTTDGGQTWSAQFSPVSVNLNAVTFSSATTGWITGDTGTLLKTTDGGLTWVTVLSPGGTAGNLYDVQFVNETHGWILGSSSNFRTTDGGNTWIPFSISAGVPYDVHFVNAYQGWISGPGGYLGYSADGGVTWTAVSTLSGAEIYTLYAKSVNEVWVAGTAFIDATQDGGSTWSTVANPPALMLEMDFMSPQLGVAVGAGGTVAVTQDGGFLWNTITLGSSDLYTVDMVAAGAGWVGGSNGVIYKSANGLNDLSIFMYHGLDTLCANVKTDVLLTIYNNGPAPIEDADIVLLDGTTPFHSYHWSGYLPAGSYQDVNLGQTAVSHTGNYTGVVYGDSVQSNNISTKFIYVVPNPVSVSLPSVICPGDSVEIGASGGESYYWFNASADSANALQTVAPLVSQHYFVSVKTTYCSVLDSVEVIVEDCTVPVTAITPNNDGKNDFLFIADLPESDNSLKIYNRWGDLVNSYANYDNETVIWDGTDASGNTLTEGTYYYVFETADLSKRVSSWVQILH